MEELGTVLAALIIIGLVLIGLSIFQVWLAARIGRKAGFRRVRGFFLLWFLIIALVTGVSSAYYAEGIISTLAPLVGLVPLYYFAFSRWPALEAGDRPEADYSRPRPITPR
jgi:hypothetical protein